MSRPRTPLDWVHRRQSGGRTNSTPSVPEINIEPPSGTPSYASDVTVHPNLLSPESAAREMPLPGDEVLNEFVDANPHIEPPKNNNPPIILSNSQLPFGFVPLAGPTTVMMASRSQTPRLRDEYSLTAFPAGLSYSDFYTRPSTSFEMAREPSTNPPFNTIRSRVQSLGTTLSPAPLQRPISLFSDT